MYLTPFGRVQDVDRLAVKMKDAVRQFTRFGEDSAGNEDRTVFIETAMMNWLLEGIREHGVTLPEDQVRAILQNDVTLNTQGIEFWLDHA
jgi:hypothetical protein